jgi:hypothetical protein
VTACTVTKNGKRERAWKGISFKKLNDDGTVTDVTSVTGFTYPNIFSNQKIEEVEIPVTSVTPVTPKFLVDNHEQSKKPIYYLRNIPVAEKCECGKFAVTKEIITPLHDTIRRCEACTDNLYKAFPAAEFRQAYPDLSNSDELEN